jgi:hypothetical protein
MDSNLDLKFYISDHHHATGPHKKAPVASLRRDFGPPALAVIFAEAREKRDGEIALF